MKSMVKLVLVLLVLLLGACSDGMKGTFEGGVMGEQALTFHGNGKATQVAAGVQVELEYEVEGDTITLRNPHQPGVSFALTRRSADLLVGGPMGMLEFQRRK